MGKTSTEASLTVAQIDGRAAELEKVLSGEKAIGETLDKLKSGARKTITLGVKEYVLFPLLSGPSFATTLFADVATELIRNVWSSGIILCGHLPAGLATFDPERLDGESKGERYIRQLHGTANISGGRIFHARCRRSTAGKFRYRACADAVPLHPSRYRER
ncbi:hypothetical protein DFR70_12375 [Nocardia tenerifensis]|uniref:Uncharacterized protein n=1 Tax=Nocardia tenerifensis TaxID=228006 RepID=A0A318JPT5_9NOCA|nr:hypothetical protein [Nocardia tenerifensis]PXX54781.1 hypothetical protein DFR70_12375 [Nocardia tenerifensis]